MDGLEKQSKNAIIILDRKYNNGLIDAIFCGTDLSDTYTVQKYIYEEKDQRWYTIATSYKFQKYTNGLINRLLIYNRTFVSDMKKIADSHEKVFIIANNAFFQGPVWCGTELRQIKKDVQTSILFFTILTLSTAGIAEKQIFLEISIQMCLILFTHLI